MSVRCAVIGNPIAHSCSPQIHHRFAKSYGVDVQYERICAEKDAFEAVVRQFFAGGGRGLNVTLPFKEVAHELAENRTLYAEKAGAVNTLWQENGKLCGDNTDGRGLCLALKESHQIALDGKRALLLGAGGAVRGVLFPLLEYGVCHIDILNRTHSRAEQLAQQYGDNVTAIAQPTASYDIVINATSAGLANDCFTMDSMVLHEKTVCYDMLYGKKTAFMSWAEQCGCQQVFDGYSMLTRQAFLSFYIWFAQEIQKL